jgi:hypothetical protein
MIVLDRDEAQIKNSRQVLQFSHCDPKAIREALEKGYRQVVERRFPTQASNLDRGLIERDPGGGVNLSLHHPINETAIKVFISDGGVQSRKVSTVIIAVQDQMKLKDFNYFVAGMRTSLLKLE